jgi:hypothetical protein
MRCFLPPLINYFFPSAFRRAAVAKTARGVKLIKRNRAFSSMAPVKMGDVPKQTKADEMKLPPPKETEKTKESFFGHRLSNKEGTENKGIIARFKEATVKAIEKLGNAFNEPMRAREYAEIGGWVGIGSAIIGMSMVVGGLIIEGSALAVPLILAGILLALVGAAVGLTSMGVLTVRG